jgi:hypothetical protein
LIGVEPILFKRDDFLNSKILLGNVIREIPIGPIIRDPPNTWSYPNKLPKIDIKIRGKKNAKKGPKIPLQKEWLIKLSNDPKP